MKSASIKAKGRAWENACASFLRGAGFPTERRRLRGNKDAGDLVEIQAGSLGLAIECKAHGRYDIPGWLNELDREIQSSGASTGFVWAKLKGKTAADSGVILMRPLMLLQILHELNRHSPGLGGPGSQRE